MAFKFNTALAEDTFNKRYAGGAGDTWPLLAHRVVDRVCGPRGTEPMLMSKDDRKQLTQYITDMKFIPGGRYLWYASRPASFFNNCFCLKAEEDTREEWAALTARAMSCLMTGGGIGIDFTEFRPAGLPLARTGGVSSGPIPLMYGINAIGRVVQQGGNRRSAIFSTLNWQHEDIDEFLYSKDDPSNPQLDMTNVSISWDDDFLFAAQNGGGLPDLWYDSVTQMCKTGEPGHCYNFGPRSKETLRNACGEFISDRDSDVCNLGSINLGNIETLTDLRDVVQLASKFLVCGTIRAELPYEKVAKVRNDYRKIGLGLMGLHEWLLKRNEKYEVTPELHSWLEVYRDESTAAAASHAERLFLNTPKAYRAIAPSGTIGLLAGTTQGIEPLYATAFKRRYLRNQEWAYQYIVDPTAKHIIDTTGCRPDSIDTAYSLAADPERRIKFQADIQHYVDMGISSTINLPPWGSDLNNETTARQLAKTIAAYCPNLRGITVYPDGAISGQPLEEVDYYEAIKHEGVIYEENDSACKSGVCGI